MNIKFIDNKEDISQFEALRSDSFGLDYGISKYYYEKFKQKTLLIIGAYKDGELIGCAYVSPFFATRGYIDQLFVREDYRNNELHVGTTLLRYIENNIKDISDYFELCLSTLLIEYCDKRSEVLYLKEGYRPTELDGTLYKRVNKQ